jgi:hypothetical protein
MRIWNSVLESGRRLKCGTARVNEFETVFMEFSE